VYLTFFFQAEDGIRDKLVTGVQTCALPILTLVVPYAPYRKETREDGVLREIEKGKHSNQIKEERSLLWQLFHGKRAKNVRWRRALAIRLVIYGTRSTVCLTIFGANRGWRRAKRLPVFGRRWT